MHAESYSQLPIPIRFYWRPLVFIVGKESGCLKKRTELRHSSIWEIRSSNGQQLILMISFESISASFCEMKMKSFDDCAQISSPLPLLPLPFVFATALVVLCFLQQPSQFSYRVSLDQKFFPRRIFKLSDETKKIIIFLARLSSARNLNGKIYALKNSVPRCNHFSSPVSHVYGCNLTHNQGKLPFFGWWKHKRKK